MGSFIRSVAPLLLAAPLVLAPVAAQAAASPGIAHASVEDFSFESFDAHYSLTRLPDGRSHLEVEERLVALFPEFDQNRGIIRAIPNDYDGVPLHVRIESVTEPSGTPVPFDAASRGGFTELALGTDEYVHGRTSYVIRYTVENVVRAFPQDGVDEFYWDVNGVGWAQPMDRVSATLTLDAAASRALTGAVACYRGPQGSTETCPISSGIAPDGTSSFEARADGIGPRESLTFAIGFAAGTFVQVDPVVADVPWPVATPGATLWNNLGGAIVLLLGLAGTGLAALLRFGRRKGAAGRGIIVPQYTPPKDTSLLEAAELVGRRGAGIPAQLISLAVRGNLRILDYGVTNPASRYTLQYLHGEGMTREEQQLIAALFGFAAVDPHSLATALRSAGFSVGQQEAVTTLLDTAAPAPGALAELGQRSPTVGTAVRAVTARVREKLLAQGALLKRSPLPGILLALLMFVLIFVAVALELIAAFLGSFFVQGFGVAFGAVFVLALCMVACLAFALRPPVVGDAGADRRDYLLGMRVYLELAEADRMRVLQSPEGAERLRLEGFAPGVSAVKLHERLLPFAVLWGVEQAWAGELALKYGSEPPEWFVGAGTFSAAAFQAALGGFGASVGSTTAPASSSGSSGWSRSGGGSFSSGSSGGGFSGGGGGGGGGGGR